MRRSKERNPNRENPEFTINVHSRRTSVDSFVPEGGLGARTRGLGSVSTSGSQLDVDSVDTNLLASIHDIGGSKHSGIRGRFVTISLHFHSTRNASNSFLSREIGNVLEDERVQTTHSFNRFTYNKGVIE